MRKGILISLLLISIIATSMCIGTFTTAKFESATLGPEIPTCNSGLEENQILSYCRYVCSQQQMNPIGEYECNKTTSEIICYCGD